MSNFVVVDASLAFKWLVEEENSDAAHAILQVWDRQGIGLAAPHLMPFEVSNALHRRVVRGELAVDVAVGLMQDLMSLGIVLHETPELHGQALKLASQLRQGAVCPLHGLGGEPRLRSVDRRPEVPPGGRSRWECPLDR